MIHEQWRIRWGTEGARGLATEMPRVTSVVACGADARARLAVVKSTDDDADSTCGVVRGALRKLQLHGWAPLDVVDSWC